MHDNILEGKSPVVINKTNGRKIFYLKAIYLQQEIQRQGRKWTAKHQAPVNQNDPVSKSIIVTVQGE